jgi:hypothetical protein
MGAAMDHKRTPHVGNLISIISLFILLLSNLSPASAQDQMRTTVQSHPAIPFDPKAYLPIIFNPAPTGPEWTISKIDTSHAIANMGDHSLRLTSDDQPRIAYGSNHLYYAHLEDIGWVIDLVDGASSVGKYTSLALDGSDLPYISYYSYSGQTYQDLKYAHWDGANWNTQTIDSVNTTYVAGTYPATAIAVDSNNNPSIAYLDYDYNYTQYKYLNDLKYADWTGTYWTYQILDNSDNIGGFISIGLDPENHPHISYFDDDYNDNLKYIQYTGDTLRPWPQITLDYADAGYYSSIAVDKESKIYISYFDETKNRLKMVSFHNDDNDTILQIVDTSSSAVAYTSIALDTHGRPHIAYYDSSKKDLKYARWTGSAWVLETIDSTGDVGRYASLALDSHDLAHISYYDASNKVLKYAVRNYQTP